MCADCPDARHIPESPLLRAGTSRGRRHLDIVALEARELRPCQRSTQKLRHRPEVVVIRRFSPAFAVRALLSLQTTERPGNEGEHLDSPREFSVALGGPLNRPDRPPAVPHANRP